MQQIRVIETFVFVNIKLSLVLKPIKRHECYNRVNSFALSYPIFHALKATKLFRIYIRSGI